MKSEKYYYDVRRKVEDAVASTFSLDKSLLPFVKKANIVETTWFDNKVCMDFDKSSLPISCNSLKDLRNRFLLYGIYCNGKFYVGKTYDFGERMITHVRDARKTKEKTIQMIHKDMMKHKGTFSFVFCELRNQDELDNAEHIAIKIAKNASLVAETENKDGLMEYVLERKKMMREYQQKRCYNIAD